MVTRFKLLTKLPSRHRLFEDIERPGAIAIADESGNTPDHTDDGTLYVDRTRPIEIDGNHISLPLRHPDGRVTRTPIGLETAFVMSERFKMPIKVASVFYTHAGVAGSEELNHMRNRVEEKGSF